MSENNLPNSSKEPISDAKKLADQHLADPNHVITEEDLAKVQIGVSGEADTPTKQAIEEGEQRVADRKAVSDEESLPGGQKATPWDVINP